MNNLPYLTAEAALGTSMVYRTKAVINGSLYTHQLGNTSGGIGPQMQKRRPVVEMASRNYKLGYCHVGLAAPAPCVPYRGKKASGVALGTSHQSCTNAKVVARNNLLQGIPPACGAYIDCGPPCKTIRKNK